MAVPNTGDLKDKQSGDSSSIAEKTLAGKIARIFSRYNELTMILIFLLMVVVLSIMSPYFLTLTNIYNIGINVSTLGILVVGVSFVVFSGNLDLSVGSAMGVSSSVLGLVLVSAGFPLWLSIVIAIFSAVCVGALNAFFVNVVGIMPIIVTIGTLNVARGLALVATRGQSLTITNAALLALGRGRFLGIPVVIYITIGLFVIAHLVLSQTKWGRSVFAIGGNWKSARLAGISIKLIRFEVFLLSGLLAGISGILTSSLTGLSYPQAGQGYELDAVTAVLLGGAALFSGKGNVLGSFVGLLIIGTLNNGMILLNIPTFWQTVAKGLMLILAVTIDQLRKAKQA